MKDKILILSYFYCIAMLFTAFSNTAYAQEIKIGAQTWDSKNLDVITFRNGDTITEAKTVREWKKASKEGKPVWCYYNNDPKNGKMFGKLYNWYAVQDSRGLAPKGWHVPSKNEWDTLNIFLGVLYAGKKMKTTSGWNVYMPKYNGSYYISEIQPQLDENGTNESGFAGLPGGYRDNNGIFNTNIGSIGSWWSLTENISKKGNSTDYAFLIYLNTNWKILYKDIRYADMITMSVERKSFGMSIRCIRDL